MRPFLSALLASGWRGKGGVGRPCGGKGAMESAVTAMRLVLALNGALVRQRANSLVIRKRRA